MDYQTKAKLKRFFRKPLLVYLFLAINVLVFLGMIVVGYFRGASIYGYDDLQIIVDFGSMSKIAVMEDYQFWRFITPIFVHLSWSHLIVNSLTLYFVGPYLEELYGHFRFLLIYILTGIAGNALGFAMGNYQTISAGASTSLFGLFGIFIMLGRMYPYQPLIQQMSQNMRLFIVMNIVFSFLSREGINWGHAGGLIGGLLLAYVIRIPVRENYNYPLIENATLKRNLATMIFVFFIAMCILYGFKKYQIYLP